MRFEDTDQLKGAEFVNVDLSGARFRNVNLADAKVMEAMLVNARFSGLIDGLVINDVEVAPLITAEMDRRYPERIKLRPRDANGVRAAWSVIEGLWGATKKRANELPEPALHERVDEEWSFLETIRHLIFVTDSWISGRVLGRTGHHHPFGMSRDIVQRGMAPQLVREPRPRRNSQSLTGARSSGPSFAFVTSSWGANKTACR